MESLMQVNSFLKHQVIYDTAKLLIGYTSEVPLPIYLYVGLISDVELTCMSGLIPKLARNEGASVMADRGFTTAWREILVVGKFGELPAKLPLVK